MNKDLGKWVSYLTIHILFVRGKRGRKIIKNILFNGGNENEGQEERESSDY
jgi:hypothetical protein